MACLIGVLVQSEMDMMLRLKKLLPGFIISLTPSDKFSFGFASIQNLTPEDFEPLEREEILCCLSCEDFFADPDINEIAEADTWLATLDDSDLAEILVQTRAQRAKEKVNIPNAVAKAIPTSPPS